MRTISTAVFAAIAMLLLGIAAQATVTLYTPAAGDATYAWNSKYGPYGYTVGENTLGIYLYFGPPYGNDHTVSIFEVPIAALAGQTVSSATLIVDSLGFGTNYWYGSAFIGWLDTGAAVLTGDVVADGLGPASMSLPSGFTIYNSDYPDEPGLKSFDVLSYVQADLAAGRSFSTFVMHGSRETYGSIYSAESGRGPRIEATVPEPASMTFLAAGVVGALLMRRRNYWNTAYCSFQ